jgi:hypothetical protein
VFGAHRNLRAQERAQTRAATAATAQLGPVRRQEPIGLVEPDRYIDGRLYAELPRGQRITIDRVREEDVGDTYDNVAYGRTIMPSTGEEVSFAYIWTSLRPPPWGST